MQVGVYVVLDIPEYQDLFKHLVNITSAQLYTCQNVSGLIWGYTDDYLQKLHDLGLSPVEVCEGAVVPATKCHAFVP